MKSEILRKVLVGAAATLCLAGAAEAKTTKVQIPTYQDPSAISLDGASGGLQGEIWEVASTGGERAVRNVTHPTLTPVLPDPSKATGAAVIVLPGGAFMELEIDGEGYEVAKRFADRGIAAFVLKYRTRHTSADSAAAQKEMIATLMSSGQSDVKVGQPGSTLDMGTQAASADAILAIRYLRDHASAFGIDPQRVGMVGFSAGAMTTLNVSVGPDRSALPNFAAIIYGPMYPVAVPKDAPPAFFAVANDDPLFGHSAGLDESWQAAGRPVEAHRYEHGGHGFAGGNKGTTSDHWFDELCWWLADRGLLKKPA